MSRVEAHKRRLTPSLSKAERNAREEEKQRIRDEQKALRDAFYRRTAIRWGIRQ